MRCNKCLRTLEKDFVFVGSDFRVKLSPSMILHRGELLNYCFSSTGIESHLR